MQGEAEVAEKWLKEVILEDMRAKVKRRQTEGLPIWVWAMLLTIGTTQVLLLATAEGEMPITSRNNC